MLCLLFVCYLSCKIDGEDRGGLGGPVGVVMVVMVSPLFLLPSEQILVAERNTAVILTSEQDKETGRGRVRKRKENRYLYKYKHIFKYLNFSLVTIHLTEATIYNS